MKLSWLALLQAGARSLGLFLLGHIFLWPLASAPARLGGTWAGPGAGDADAAWGSLSGHWHGPFSFMAEVGDLEATKRQTLGASDSRSGRASLRWSRGPLFVSAGHRFLPVETEFLAAPGGRSLLYDVPTLRKMGSVFLGPVARDRGDDLTLPGLFALEGRPGAGVYWVSPWGASVFCHPGVGVAAFVMRGKRSLDPALQADWLIDLNRSGYASDRISAADERTRDTLLWQGYARARITRKSRTLLRVLALRSNEWDLAPGKTVVGRRGRSGAAAAVGRPLWLLSFEGAGLDRAAESYRVFGVAIGDNEGRGLFPVLRARYYRAAVVRVRAPNESKQLPRENTGPERSDDRGLAPGVRWARRDSSFEIYGEGRGRGTPSLELRARHATRGKSLSATLLLRKSTRETEVLYTESGSFRDGGPLFFHDRERVMRLEGRARNFSLLIATTLGNGRPDHFARLQLSWELDGSGRSTRLVPAP